MCGGGTRVIKDDRKFGNTLEEEENTCTLPGLLTKDCLKLFLRPYSKRSNPVVTEERTRDREGRQSKRDVLLDGITLDGLSPGVTFFGYGGFLVVPGCRLLIWTPACVTHSGYIDGREPVIEIMSDYLWGSIPVHRFGEGLGTGCYYNSPTYKR